MDHNHGPADALREQHDICPYCLGSGRDPDDLGKDCPECGGDGYFHPAHGVD